MEEDWSQLSPEELMAKKDAIEAEMQACNTVLENVRLSLSICSARDRRTQSVPPPPARRSWNERSTGGQRGVPAGRYRYIRRETCQE